jgi:hypothetical protein
MPPSAGKRPGTPRPDGNRTAPRNPSGQRSSRACGCRPCSCARRHHGRRRRPPRARTLPAPAPASGVPAGRADAPRRGPSSGTGAGVRTRRCSLGPGGAQGRPRSGRPGAGGLRRLGLRRSAPPHTLRRQNRARTLKPRRRATRTGSPGARRSTAPLQDHRRRACRAVPPSPSSTPRRRAGGRSQVRTLPGPYLVKNVRSLRCRRNAGSSRSVLPGGGPGARAARTGRSWRQDRGSTVRRPGA